MQELGLITSTATEAVITVPCKYNYNGNEYDANVVIEAKIESNYVEVISFKININITEIRITQTSDAVQATVGGNVASVTEEGVPIPKGFTYLKGTRNTGVVISDSDGNEFVWVPVNVNPKLNISIESEQNITEVIVQSLGDYKEIFTPNSNKFTKTIDVTENEMYTVLAKFEDGTEKEKLYKNSNVYKNYNYSYIFDDLLKALAENDGVTVEQYYSNLKAEALKENPNVETVIDALKEEESFAVVANMEYQDTTDEKDSVLKYGGFYIARYEVGTDEDGNTSVKKGNTAIKNISYSDAKTAAEEMYTASDYGVNAILPSGAAWQRIGHWYVETGKVGSRETYISGATCGNVDTGNALPTGNSEDYCVNNIYDIVGNLSEWITLKEIDDTTGEPKTGNIKAGGYYNIRSNAAVCHFNNTTSSGNTIGYRPILYILDN